VRAAALVAMVLAVAVAGCGEPDSASRASSATPLGDAFVVRLFAHQQVAAQLADRGRRRARDPRVRALARRMVRLRESKLAVLGDLRRRIADPALAGDLGVPAERAADEITPAALEGVRPFDDAFLALMARHDQGAIALAEAGRRRAELGEVRAVASRALGEYTTELAAINRVIAARARSR